MIRKLLPYQYAVDISIAVVAVLVRVVIDHSNLHLLVVVFFMGVAVAFRRISPAIALSVLWLGVAIQLSWGLGADYSNAAVLPVLYVTSRYGSSALKWIGLASAGFGALLATTYTLALGYGFVANGLYNPLFSLTQLPRLTVIGVIGLILGLGLFGLSWTLGLLVKTWSAARESREAQKAAEVEQAVAEREVGIEQERTRIARDMHDVVAHSLAVVIAQADGARYARQTNPDAVDEALTTISTTAREALGDVRILLGQLRHSEGAGPQPVLADLDRLIEQMRASGLLVRREEAGEARALATGQQLAVYRIVQESLTNALRHGDPSIEVLVRFAWTDNALDLDVSSGLLAAPATDSKPGHGLDGMRERAILAGGTLRTGAHGDRFVVSAHLPALGTEAIMQVIA